MSTSMLDTIELIRGESSRKGPKEYRIVRSIKPGQFIRQGDVYVLCVGDNTELGKPSKMRQLAPGSSKGSRHIVEGDARMSIGWVEPEGLNLYAQAAKMLRVPRERIVAALAGPAIHADGAFRVTHPEHADYTLPGGCYVTWGQLDPRTMRRVQD